MRNLITAALFSAALSLETARASHGNWLGFNEVYHDFDFRVPDDGDTDIVFGWRENLRDPLTPLATLDLSSGARFVALAPDRLSFFLTKLDDGADNFTSVEFRGLSVNRLESEWITDSQLTRRTIGVGLYLQGVRSNVAFTYVAVFSPFPDTGSTAALFGLGIAGIATVRRKVSQAR